MRRIASLIALLGIGILISACNTTNPPDTAATIGGNNWAKDNLDLQRIGYLLERSDTPQEFEGYLNEEHGIDNLDLNGDGYADYISVEEFGYDGPNERGLSLYASFGPDQVQDLATVYFYRDEPDWRGARVLVVGDDNIYGDNVYYETNWADAAVGLISFLFTPRDSYYRSPYYYNYYPADYVAYEVVETPMYVTRVQRLYPEPVLVYTTAPTLIERIKIKSPNDNKRFDRIYAKLAKPTKQQIEFIARNPQPPERVKTEPAGRRDAPGQQKQLETTQPPVGSEERRTEKEPKPGKEQKPQTDRKPGADKQQPQRASEPPGKKAKPAKPSKPGKPGV